MLLVFLCPREKAATVMVGRQGVRPRQEVCRAAGPRVNNAGRILDGGRVEQWTRPAKSIQPAARPEVRRSAGSAWHGISPLGGLNGGGVLARLRTSLSQPFPSLLPARLARRVDRSLSYCACRIFSHFGSFFIAYFGGETALGRRTGSHVCQTLNIWCVCPAIILLMRGQRVQAPLFSFFLLRGCPLITILMDSLV